MSVGPRAAFCSARSSRVRSTSGGNHPDNEMATIYFDGQRAMSSRHRASLGSAPRKRIVSPVEGVRSDGLAGSAAVPC